MDPQESRATQQRERYRELLEELRTILPGVQVLFAFLLIAPFSARFSELDQLGRNGYIVALCAAALAMMLFLSPASLHRVGPRKDRRARLRASIVLTITGMAAVTVAVTSSLFVVTRFVFGAAEGTAVAGGAAGAMGLLWYAMPLVQRLRERHAASEHDDG